MSYDRHIKNTTDVQKTYHAVKKANSKQLRRQPYNNHFYI